VLVFLHLGSRRVYLSQPTFHPDEAWVMQQARNVTMWLDDHGIEARYLIHDRDTKFTKQFDAFWKGAGVPASVFRRKRRRPTPSANPSSAPANTSA
jgi:putative transposase